MRRSKKNRTRRAWWVLLVTCLASFATAEAAQAAYPVKLKVTVERVKALDCVDEDDEITPDDWSAEKLVDLEVGKVRVDVQLRDLDGGFRGPSEQVDITPTV